jgi:putative two-component system response regulator
MSEILVVDDEPGILSMMKRVLGRAGYKVSMAKSGQEAFDSIAAKLPDLILLDLYMPIVDGFEVAAQLKNTPETREIPIILITGLDSSQNHVKAMDLGINDFLSKTAKPEEILARIRSHLNIKQLNDQVKGYQASLENMVALRTAQLKDASLEVIWRLAAASEYRDNETGAHIKRMSLYAAAIAQEMGLVRKAVEAILYGAPLHDIGKIGIPDAILLKPGKLDADEWETMKTHTTIGGNILKDSRIGFVRMGAMIAMTHHEKWDGSGYPKGLRTKQIPLAGRIVALADVFDALTSERPYKKAISIDDANRIIEEGRGNHFDPDVLDAFFSVQDEILAVKTKYQNETQDHLWCMGHMVDDGAIVYGNDCRAS